MKNNDTALGKSKEKVGVSPATVLLLNRDRSYEARVRSFPRGKMGNARKSDLVSEVIKECQDP